MTNHYSINNKSIVGWREWVGLPGLNIPSIKAKIDTGARTSALHAFNIESFNKAGEPWVSFLVHPNQRDDTTVIRCEAQLIDQRFVANSGGTREKRCVISSSLRMGNSVWPIELTLSNRDELGFRMLIGRTALKGRIIVDPAVSYRSSRTIAKTESNSNDLTGPAATD